MRLVHIKWLDSCGVTTNWDWLKDIKHNAVTCSSIGWVVKENEECISIASHIAHNSPKDEDQVCGIMTIPRVAITEMKEVEL